MVVAVHMGISTGVLFKILEERERNWRVLKWVVSVDGFCGFGFLENGFALDCPGSLWRLHSWR